MRLIISALVLTSTLAMGCSMSPCERLTDEVCAARGEDDERCQARRETDDRSRLGDLLCKRSLFLYQGEAGGGGSR